MYKVEGKEVDILDADWDLAIIIDSCRYDVFKEYYKKILETNSEVKKAYSRCTCTREFMQTYLNKPFVDIVYVNHTVSIGYWIPDARFFKLVDVWKTHWDYDTWGTIMPWDMTDVTLEMIKKYPDKRVMLHYVQVHPPYLLPGYEPFRKELTPEQTIEKQERRKARGDQFRAKKRFRNFTSFYQGVLRNTFGYERTWRFLDFLGVDIEDAYGRMYKEMGMKGLINGYHGNMKIVLKEAKRLLDKTERKVLITSDHSQKFDGSKKNIVNEPVPWLELK